MNLQPEMFVDFDLPETCTNKASILRHFKELSSIIFQETEDNHDSSSIHTKQYILQPMDLTDLDSLKSFIESGIIDVTFVDLSFIHTSLPTLFLSECVLVYIQPDDVNPSLQYLQETFKNNMIVVYEQIRPDDPFGSMMMKNLHV